MVSDGLCYMLLLHQSEKLRLTFTVVQENLRIQSYIISSIRKHIYNKTTNELISNQSTYKFSFFLICILSFTNNVSFIYYISYSTLIFKHQAFLFFIFKKKNFPF